MMNFGDIDTLTTEELQSLIQLANDRLEALDTVTVRFTRAQAKQLRDLLSWDITIPNAISSYTVAILA